VLLDEKEPFFKRLQDRVVFSRGSAVSDPVDVVVRFSELAPDSIRGEILGTNATFGSLKPVFEDRSAALCSMVSAFPNGPARLSSSQVMLRSITRRVWQEREPANEPLNVAGQFECIELLIDERQPGRDLETRGIEFYLPEDIELWRPSSLELGFNAFRLRPEEGEEIATGLECRFRVKGQPSFVYDRSGQPSSRWTLSAILPTLQCTLYDPNAQYTDESFHTEAKEVADDVLLLASLVTRRLIRWHRYVAFGPRGLHTVVRSTSRAARSTQRTDISELPVPLYQFRDLVPVAIPKLRALRAQDLDLELPILYIVGSHEAATIDQRFSYAVLCLERLVDLHARAQGLDEIVPKKIFEPIRRQLSREIERAFASLPAETLHPPVAEANGLMQEKLTELNRRPFWALLSTLLDAYGVQWTDLYPPGLPRPTLISTRNKFIHSSEKPSYKRLLREAARVQALCERVLLRMLGRQDPYTPTEGTRQWLVRPEEE
jgi:hypothetical protein